MFSYKNGEFCAEDVPVNKIAQEVGTPCYVYSYKFIEDTFNDYKDAFMHIEPIICYSAKANTNLSILKAFSSLGSGFDIVSVGELKKALKIGADPNKIVFSGVGKTREEIVAAIEAGILFFNVESVDELEFINEIAISLGKKAPISLRVNPDISPKTHPYISTGFKKSKFGIEINSAFEVYKDSVNKEGLEIIGIDAHIGSQIFEITPFIDSLRKLIVLADRLVAEGINIQYIDIGGGLGIKYENEEQPLSKKDFADAIIKELSGKSYKIVLEPGRSLIGNGGILLTSVLYNKVGTEKKFIIIDAAMNDLIRPAFYNSYHEIVTATENNSTKNIYDIVGPICESGDFLAKDREFPQVCKGDVLAVKSAGAYGFVMSFNYNSRPRAAEVLVRGDKYFVIKQRESFEDLIKGEEIINF
ncbi:MAG TPA: diaminopimelate decarboxylase [Thermodesulfobacteriota bacterium]|nr:diaminopimelate decarboxylase [Thermodesulfobacteriota bacterium]